MNDNVDESDHRHGRYLSGDSVDGEDLAKICRRLGLSGPLEPLLRELKCEPTQKYPQYVNVKEASRKHGTSKSVERKNAKKDKEFDECGDAQHLGGRGAKSSTYGQESWGRDSGARDLSPEPHPRDMCDNQHTDSESGTNSMIHLANKVRNCIHLLQNFDWIVCLLHA